MLISVCALVIPVALIEMQVIHLTNGTFIYPLDDTYIHMTIAKNLAAYGSWGVAPHQFQSASSSILYTLILSACFKIFSANALIPFIINLITGIVLLFVIQNRLKKENIGAFAQLIILLLIIFFTPLPILIISGMEHTLQCLFSFLFIFSFSDFVQSGIQKKINQLLPNTLFIYGLIICTLRYEGLFIIAIACCVLLYYKYFKTAVILGFISVLPLVIFGFISVLKDSYFLPNSVLLKASPVELSGSSFSNYIYDVLVEKLTLAKTGITALATQRLLILLPFVFVLFKKQLKEFLSYQLVILFLSICTLLQLAFAKTGWFYRYEAYLILCSVVVVSIIIVKLYKALRLRENKALLPVIALATFFLFFPLILRSSAAFTKATQACVNIYEQQYQMGDFIKKYYDTDIIAVNDIGAVSFFNNSEIIDLWGLANMQVAKAKKENKATPAYLNSVVKEHQVDFAIVYDSWFDSTLLKHWRKVADWTIENNVICGDATVSFYAVKQSNDSLLKKNLEHFRQQLPADVSVKYY